MFIYSYAEDSVDKCVIVDLIMLTGSGFIDFMGEGNPF
jgi:hypothetical protein